MNEQLKTFVQRISGFDNLSASDKIPYFVYYLTKEDEGWINARDIKLCYDSLYLMPYSNISSYLSRNSGKSDSIFIKSKDGYRLSRYMLTSIVSQIGESVEISISDDLIPTIILQNTQFYLEKMAYQMCACYECGLYDASLVMMRKLIETLIIECFERYGIDNLIKDSNGTFFYLSDLIPIFINCDKWNVSRNLKNGIEKVKKYGDLSAHNRRFIAHKPDFDKFKFELRQAIQEIILIIDYPKWNKS